MKYVSNMKKNNLKDNKILVLSVIFIVLLVVYVAIPTLSEYTNANPTYNTITVWDGITASSYSDGDGSEENPYIISNGQELSYFASQLKTNDYEGKYFILTNDIVLNDGIFSYDDSNGIKYKKDNEEIIIVPNTENNIINSFEHLNNFKGSIDGNHHVIYGIYIDEPIEEQNALFTNLEGNISNLYIKNSIIYGGKIVAGVASKATNSMLTNISYDGYVISDEEIATKELFIEIDEVQKTVTDLELNDYINIPDLDYIPGIITEINLKGTYQSDNTDAILKINDEVINPGEFEINLGQKIKTNITLNYQTNIESNFNLSNLKYEIKYNYNNTAGIVSIAEKTTLKNIINKADVYGKIYASGIANLISGKSSLTNVYNTSKIESDNISTGLISAINQNKEDITISNSYNNGTLSSNNNAMIGNIENNTETITLTNIFNTKEDYAINLIEETNVVINNFYIVSDNQINIGSVNGEFTTTTLEDLKTKSYLKEKLNFKEYSGTEVVDDNVWIWSFETDTLPTLYIDEVNKRIANIYAKDYVWNNYKTTLDTLKFSDKLVFSIEEVNLLNPIKETYYYISNDKESLTKEELNSITSWNKYEEIIEIEEEGFYVLYVKLIDDNDNEIYINTDLLVIDLTGSSITITPSLANIVWNDFKTELNNYYIDKEITINIKAEDKLSGINKIYYYVSDSVLTQDDLEKIESWNEYTEEINISNKKSILYAKVVDNCNYSTFANSDLIILNGYTLNSISPGMNGNLTEEENIYITNDSSISLNYLYQDESNYANGSNHQLISNVLLPENTKITLIDKTKNKVYMYKTTNDDYGYNDCDETCEAKYNLELFKEVGSTLYFDENNYKETINENIIIILDFKDATINENIENIFISLRINNENKNEIRNTLVESKKKFSIIKENSQAKFTLTTNFEDTINYRENAKYTIDFNTKLNYQMIDDAKIYDTSFEDKTLGLSIKMINDKGNIISKQNLKNVSFKIGDKKYLVSDDGIVKINLEKGIKDITDNLIIQTFSDNSNLETGNYKFVITLYTAYDGINPNEELTNIEIPVYVGENIYNNDSSFNVIMNNDDKIITTNKNEFNFEILTSNISENTNIKVSLYKKNSFDAIDQNYTIIDLEQYMLETNLEKYDENIYYVSKDEYSALKINLDTSKLEKQGYMFVFELCEGEKIVNKISKKFIVK